jgi:hypothetical protein
MAVLTTGWLVVSMQQQMAASSPQVAAVGLAQPSGLHAAADDEPTAAAAAAAVPVLVAAGPWCPPSQAPRP